MIKADIIKKVAATLDKNDKEALVIVDNIIESVKEVICEHQRLEIRDFGVFQIKQRKPRIGRNPKDKKEYPIPPRKVVKFKSGKKLKQITLEEGKTPEPVEAVAGE